MQKYIISLEDFQIISVCMFVVILLFCCFLYPLYVKGSQKKTIAVGVILCVVVVLTGTFFQNHVEYKKGMLTAHYPTGDMVYQVTENNLTKNGDITTIRLEDGTKIRVLNEQCEILWEEEEEKQ